MRETLGCACPEATFESVQRGTLSGVVGTAVTRLVIGERLLIYVAGGEPDVSRVIALAGAGRRDRDAHGLNRFRLVVGLPAEAGGVAALEQAFRGAVGDDPKAHLHCVSAAACAAALPER